MKKKIKKASKKIIDFSRKHKYLVVFLLICVLIIGISRLVSYAFFTASDSKTLISGKVGDVTNSDLDFKVLVENRDSNGVGNGTYTTSYQTPTNGYAYNSSISSCDNGTLTYNSSTNSFTVSATGRTKCNIYYDAETINYSNDVTLVLMKEKKSPSCKGNCGYEEVTDLSVTGLINSGYMYNSDLSNCTGTSTITFNQTTNEINTVYNGQDTCTAYFKVSDAPIIKSVTLDSRTTTSLTLTVNTVPMAPKAVSYYYSLDGTDFTEVSEKTFTISSLTIGTEYNVRIYTKSADNISSNVSTIVVSTASYPVITLLAGDATITSSDYTLTNMMTNGSFETNDVSSWYNHSSNVSRNSTYHLYGSYSLEVTKTTSDNVFPRKDLSTYSGLTNHQIYVSINAYRYQTGGGVTYVILTGSFAAWNSDKTELSLYTDPDLSTWTKYSQIVTSDYSYLSNVMLAGVSSYNGTSSILYDGFLILDLTTAYGTDIPTKTWLDTNINYFTKSMAVKKTTVTGTSTTFTVASLSGYTLGTTVSCNNGATAVKSGSTITVSNITGDNICSIYAS